MHWIKCSAADFVCMFSIVETKKKKKNAKYFAVGCVNVRRKNRTGLLKPYKMMNSGAVAHDCVFKLKQSVRMSKKHCWLRAFEERVLKKKQNQTLAYTQQDTLECRKTQMCFEPRV